MAGAVHKSDHSLGDLKPGDEFVVHPLMQRGDHFVVCRPDSQSNGDPDDVQRPVVHLATGVMRFMSAKKKVFLRSKTPTPERDGKWLTDFILPRWGAALAALSLAGLAFDYGSVAIGLPVAGVAVMFWVLTLPPVLEVTRRIWGMP